MPKFFTAFALIGVMMAATFTAFFVNHNHALGQESTIVLAQLEPNWNKN